MKKSVVVTGGTKGIGKAVIELFAREGFDIATCARNENDLINLQNEIQEKYPKINFIYQKADLSEKQEVLKFARFVKSTNATVEILVNNAGIFTPGQIHTEEDGVLEMTMNINLYSVYYLTRQFVGEMKQRQSGHIFNLCSTASIIPYINGGSYCISKFALLGMTKVLREEMKEHGVRVTAILPGATLTASWEGADLPPERFMKPEDVAEAILSAYKMSDRSVVEELLIRPQLGDI
jgi:short-subunit dehydrogenase